MATVHADTVLRYVRRACVAGANFTDGQLLDRYICRREEAAFEAIVRRHGSMVLGVCNRILGNAADAEDAFQATFLVLIRKATTIQPRDRVGAWLHGVAYRTALKARCAAARRRGLEAMMGKPEAVPVASPDDWRAVLDQELQRLPEKYRTAIVSCDLEGKTRKDAARRLGWAEGTLSSRLGRGRAKLQARLCRRGVVLGISALAANLADASANDFVSPGLISATLRAHSLAVVAATSMAIPSHIAALMNSVTRSMAVLKLKKCMAVTLLTVSILGLAFGGYHAFAAGEETPQASPTSKPEITPASKAAKWPHLPIKYLSLPEAIAIAIERETNLDEYSMEVKRGAHAQVLALNPSSGQGRGVVLARLTTELSSAKFEIVVRNVLLNTELAYWNLYRAHGDLYASVDSLRQVNKLWRLTNERIANGELDKQDLFAPGAQLEEFSGDVAKALERLHEAESTLRYFLCSPGEQRSRIIPVSPPTLLEYQPNWEAAKRDALDRRPELIIARQDLKKAQSLLAAEKLNPKVNPARDHSAIETTAERKARANLQDQDMRVMQTLTFQYQKVKEWYRRFEIAKAERSAYAESVKSYWELWNADNRTKAKSHTIILSLLQYQRSLTLSRQKEYEAIAQYNCRLAHFEWARGTILQHNNMRISRGLPQGQQLRAVENERRRTRVLIRDVHPEPLTYPGLLVKDTTWPKRSDKD